MKTVGALLSWAAQSLKNRLEAEILLSHALGTNQTSLYAYPEKQLNKKELKNFKSLVKRRLKHEPIAYLTKYQPFMGLKITVDKSVLIPRPETELLAEEAIKTLDHSKKSIIYDIGTGSGAIAVALAKFLPKARVIGTDLSKKALAVAKKNARIHGVSKRCVFLTGDLFSPLKGKADLIVANPPYVPTAEINKLEKDVKDWEPRAALDGGKDGLKYIRRIIDKAPSYLKPAGRLMLEIGYGQAKALPKHEIKRDYAGIPRILIVRIRNRSRTAGRSR